MSFQQFIIAIIVVAFVYAIFNCYRAKTRVYCTFQRRDKTVTTKWAKAKNGERIEFDGGWYYVNMKRITLRALESGFSFLFPTMVRCLEFRYNSSQPVDPETGENNWETPEARKNLNKREDIESLEMGSQRAMGKVKTGLLGTGWLPVILVLGIVICLYLVFQMRGQIDSVGNAINVLQEMMLEKF